MGKGREALTHSSKPRCHIMCTCGDLMHLECCRLTSAQMDRLPGRHWDISHQNQTKTHNNNNMYICKRYITGPISREHPKLQAGVRGQLQRKSIIGIPEMLIFHQKLLQQEPSLLLNSPNSHLTPKSTEGREQTLTCPHGTTNPFPDHPPTPPCPRHFHHLLNNSLSEYSTSSGNLEKCLRISLPFK